jgi:hypothetical protein
VHFNSQTATLLYAANRLYKWKLQIDENTRISIEQQNSVARDYLDVFRKGLVEQKIIKATRGFQKAMPGENTKSHLQTIRFQGKQEKINQIFSEENLVPAVLTTRWGNILPCIHTEIAGVFYNSNL